MMSFSRSTTCSSPGIVEDPDVSGMEPAVGVEDLPGGLVVVPVAGEHVRPRDPDLAGVVVEGILARVVHEPDRQPREADGRPIPGSGCSMPTEVATAGDASVNP